MKIAIVTAAFKGTLTAAEAARCVAGGLVRAWRGFRTTCLPVADGGAGTVDAVVRSRGGAFRHATVTGPLGNPMRARYGVIDGGRTAVIEMAAASGLSLLASHQRNPFKTTTYGTGEVIKTAILKGAARIIVGVGDSATVDGGAGMAQALGARLLDARGKQIPRGNAGLAKLSRIDLSEMLPLAHPKAGYVEVLVACDVDNPLVGPRGAAHVFGPQKFASPPRPAKIRRMDENLAHFARIVKRDIGVSLAKMKSAGAAGGLAGGLCAFLGAQLCGGFDLIADLTGLEEQIRGHDLVITGEGRLDAQTARGKAPAGAARIAKKLGIPVIAIGGTAGEGVEKLRECGVDAYFVCRQAADAGDAGADAAERLAECAAQVGGLIALARAKRRAR